MNPASAGFFFGANVGFWPEPAAQDFRGRMTATDPMVLPRFRGHLSKTTKQSFRNQWITQLVGSVLGDKLRL